MRIPKPFIPLRLESTALHHTVHILERDYTFGPDGFLTSVVSQGHELLAAPMRVVCEEDGGPAVWDDNYPENESESFVQSRSEEQAVICGARQSERFIIDICSTVGYDGNIEIDFKVMPRGKTVAQVFGISGAKPIRYQMDKLWLEIPLKEETARRYNMYPNGPRNLADGTVLPENDTSSCSKLPDQTMSVPFKPLFWLGNDERGLGWYAERNRYWQPEKQDHAMEVVPQEDCVILRIRLLDSHPLSWKLDPEEGMSYQPIDFQFGFQATPVKPFPKQPYLHNAFHLDCGIKIKGNYRDFLDAENRFDRLVETGVTTLILHEKWNKSQNWYELSEYTADQLSYIVTQCHNRGIRVLPYFGYEISTMSPAWSKLQNRISVKDENQVTFPAGGWWRVPFQRDHATCNNSEYADLFVEGITRLMDQFHFDGVYLDTVTRPDYCCSLEHGCGWYDEKGNIHGTYSVKSTWHMMQKLYEAVEQRGGMINVHAFGYTNFTTLPYIHQSWCGENLQFSMMKGSTEDVDLEYFRTEYTGRNMGVPVELIVYENRPLWKFESALSCALLHGILPRPNDIGHPLKLMSTVWKIIGAFPISQSEWLPYWSNQAKADHQKVRISYYRYTALDGEMQMLAFVGNVSAAPIDQVNVCFPEAVTMGMDMEKKENVGFSFSLEPYGYRILFLR